MSHFKFLTLVAVLPLMIACQDSGKPGGAVGGTDSGGSLKPGEVRTGNGPGPAPARDPWLFSCSNSDTDIELQILRQTSGQGYKIVATKGSQPWLNVDVISPQSADARPDSLEICGDATGEGSFSLKLPTDAGDGRITFISHGGLTACALIDAQIFWERPPRAEYVLHCKPNPSPDPLPEPPVDTEPGLQDFEWKCRSLTASDVTARFAYVFKNPGDTRKPYKVVAFTREPGAEWKEWYSLPTPLTMQDEIGITGKYMRLVNWRQDYFEAWLEIHTLRTLPGTKRVFANLATCQDHGPSDPNGPLEYPSADCMHVIYALSGFGESEKVVPMTCETP